MCIFSATEIGRGHVYLEYSKSAKSTAIIEYTQEVLPVKCEFRIFFGARFFCMYKGEGYDLREPKAA